MNDVAIESGLAIDVRGLMENISERMRKPIGAWSMRRDSFGTHRAMFASDFPVERVHGSFDAFYSAFDAITADFSADERDRLFAGNAEAIYRI